MYKKFEIRSLELQIYQSKARIEAMQTHHLCDVKKENNLIHLPTELSFGVDFLSGLGWCNKANRENWEFEKNIDGSHFLNFFEQVVPRVNAIDRQRFVDDVCQLDKHSIITEPYMIHTGFTFVDKMDFSYHTDDYEFSSPIKMEGRHIFVAAA